MSWYNRGRLKFKPIEAHRYVCWGYEIVVVNGYYFAFYGTQLLNKKSFTKNAAYNACLLHNVMKLQ